MQTPFLLPPPPFTGTASPTPPEPRTLLSFPPPPPSATRPLWPIETLNEGQDRVGRRRISFIDETAVQCRAPPPPRPPPENLTLGFPEYDPRNTLSYVLRGPFGSHPLTHHDTVTDLRLRNRQTRPFGSCWNTDDPWLKPRFAGGPEEDSATSPKSRDSESSGK